MEKLLNNIAKSHIATKEELISILENDNINSKLFKLADDIRQQYVGNEIHLRGLIEFSNICKCNCQYCGLRYDNKTIERYHLAPEEIINNAKLAKELGYKTVVLQSGEDLSYTAEKMSKIIREIKKLDLAITLSLGEKSFEEYKSYKDAGANRYLLRIETTNENLYKNMHPNMSLDNRKRCLSDLKNLNYEVGSGFLVGLPNQTIDSIADDLLFLQEINVDMAGIGPFIPCPNTPLENYSNTTFDSFTLSLKAMALIRLLLPDINIPATTAMETINPNGRILALKSGANVIMPNVTDINYRKKYSIYPGKTSKNTTSKENLDNAKKIIEIIKRTIATDFGISKNWLKNQKP